MAYLRELFGNRLISGKTSFEWPAASPDFNPCDFCLWPRLKNQIFAEYEFSDNYEDRERLKIIIDEEIDLYNSVEFEREIIKKACGDSFLERLKLCVEAGGGHFAPNKSTFRKRLIEINE